MKTEMLQQVLEGEGGVRAESKGVYVVSDEVDLTLLLDMGHEPMSVARVRRIQIKGDLLAIETHKGDRVYTAVAVSGLKFGASDAGKSRGTGFTAAR